MTGGAGFIGSNLVEELVKEHEVIVLDNFQTGSMENLREVGDKVKVIKTSCGDILNFGLVSVDFIFHFGIPSLPQCIRRIPSWLGRQLMM